MGGNTYSNIYNVPIKQAYQNEIVSPAESTTYSAKIGLLYVSDYGYAASPEGWNTVLNDIDYTSNDINWMYMGGFDWTISRYSEYADGAFFVDDSGYVSHGSVRNYRGVGVRPSFYLESSVELSGGSGTSADPYRLS